MRRASKLLVIVTAILLASLPAGAAGRGEPGPVFPAEILLFDEEAELLALVDLGIDIEGVIDGRALAHLIQEELEKLRGLGYQITVSSDNGPAMALLASEQADTPIYTDTVPATYHTYATLTADLQTIVADHPDITRLSSAGQSVQGRELWVMKITGDPDVEQFEPEFAYISSMHGDEVVGKEMVFNLIDYLTDNYGTDPRVTALVDNTEIWILPSMNPDGTEMGQRYNANGYDLNRDFPDQFTDPVDTPAGRQPETQAIMTWAEGVYRSLGANFHCGVLVANYPLDGTSSGSSVYSAAPDDNLFVSISREYADDNPPMWANNSHSSFDNGICDGADWYVVRGAMQDWNYVWRGNMELTLEISETDWPPASQLPGFWDDNLESMLSFMERVQEGVGGIVTDAQTGLPLAATVTAAGNQYPFFTDPAVGDYHRVLLPGSYTLEVSATGYSTRLIPVEVNPGPAARYDVALEPLDVSLQIVDACAEDLSDCQSWLDPGVGEDVMVTLANLGLGATSIDAQLEPTGWFTEVGRPDAVYPDLLPGASGASLPPHHGLSVSADTPAGHKVGFVARWQSDQGSGVSDPFFLPVDPSVCTTVDAAGLPLSVKDHLTSASGIDFIVDHEIDSVEVFVDVTHGYVGDLRVELFSPAGTPLALHARTGGSSNDIYGTYGVDLDPAEPLSRMNGESSLGSWALRVHDGVTGNQGTLDAWSLEVCGRPFETATPEMRFSDLSRSPGAVQLRWWPYPGIESYRVYRSTDPSSAGSFVDVTAEDTAPEDTAFDDTSPDPVLYWLVTGVGPNGEGPKGHFGE